MTPAQCRAARLLLKWSQRDLAAAASISLPTVWNFEHKKFKALPTTLSAMRTALKAAGADFPDEEVEVWTKLSKNHITLLEQLVERSRMTWGTLPEGCLELEDAGYVRCAVLDPSETLTMITDAGRQALADAKKNGQPSTPAARL